MTDIASSWKKIVRRHPRALSIAMLILWCTQLLYWGLWEFRRKPIKKTPALSKAIEQEADVHIEPPMFMTDSNNIPDSPFITQFAIEEGTDSDSEQLHLDEPQAGPSLPIFDPPKINEEPTPVAPPKNPAEALGTLRYCGFIQTTHGVRVAFIEDKTDKRMLRIQVGESIEDWELVAIARDRIIFTAEKEPPVEILRDFLEAELAPPVKPLPKPAPPKKNTEQQIESSETVEADAAEEIADKETDP